MGKAIKIAPAAKRVKLFENCELTKLYNPNANVKFCGLRKIIRGKIKSINGAMKLKSATTAKIGFANGKRIWKNIRK